MNTQVRKVENRLEDNEYDGEKKYIKEWEAESSGVIERRRQETMIQKHGGQGGPGKVELRGLKEVPSS